MPEDCRVLTTQDILALVQKLVSLPHMIGVPEDSKDFAADAIALDRGPIRAELDEYEHFGNRRLRTTGELIQEAFRVGLYRMERVVRERMTTEDVDTITPQTIINIRPVVAALKEFFGSSQLSQFMQQTNSLDGLTHRRRLSALGAGGLTRERAPIEVRDVHPTHYGRMCPIETPEGPNIGLIGSLASMATVSQFGFIQTPYRKVVTGGRVTDEIVYLDAAEEAQYTIAQASEPRRREDGQVRARRTSSAARREGEAVMADPKEIEFMDVSPAQIVSVATAMIPFLEHNDANRALMGANMQRQAVPLMIPQAPLVGTGARVPGRRRLGRRDRRQGRRRRSSSSTRRDIVVEGKGTRDEYDLIKFMRSNQGTLIHHKPIVRLGDKVVAGSVLADGSSTDHGELALGANLLVAFMPFEGYNFEDAIVLSERLVKDEVLTSIHIHEYEIDARSTKLGDEEITRDIPNRSEESLRNLDDRGIVRIGAEVGSGDLLVGKVTPKGETELTAEEKLIRAIFKEKAREVRDTSLKVPHGEGGVVIDVKTFSRDTRRRPAPGRERARPRLRREEAQDQRGRQARRPPRQQGRHLEDRPRGGHAVPRGRPLGRHPPEPARRAEPDEHRPDPRDPSRLGRRARRLRRRRRRGDERQREPRDQRAEADAGRDARLRRRDGRGRRRGARRPGPSQNAGQPDQARRRQEGRPPAAASPARCRLFNGRTGEPFEQKVTVGYMYILKLLHLVDDKIHARSTGPYSLVTQQPLGGKAQFGGQRFGEMEVWALEAYGAAYTLQEMLTIKSDDTVGRVKAYEAIVKGENIAEPSIPESFKVLLKEMQSLALDVQVISEDGGEVEVREEDDELLRAAEELGIDLSPGSLRVAAGAVEGEEPEADAEVAERGRARSPSEVVAAEAPLADARRRSTWGRAVDDEDAPGRRPRRHRRGSGRLGKGEAHDRHQRFRRDPDRARVEQADPRLVVGRGHQAGDDQLPHAQARAGRPLLRAHLRSDQGLGVLLRQVQARPLQGHHLRALRRRGDPPEGAPRAHGSHRPRRSGLAHLVLQGRPEPHRLPARHRPARAREGALLRRLDHHRASTSRRAPRT